MKKSIENLTELESLNPITLKEYCYRDGAPTDWYRKPLTPKEADTGRIAYYCNECADRGYFNLKRKKEREG